MSRLALGILGLLAVLIAVSGQFVNTVTIGQQRYATLDDAAPDQTVSATADRFASIPPGWNIAPANDASRAAAIRSGWGADCLVLADGSLAPTSSGRNCGTFLSVSSSGAVRPLTKRVLVVQQVSAFTSAIPTSATIEGGVRVTILGTNLGEGSDIVQVLLAGSAASIQSQTTSSVVVTSPAVSTPSSGPIQVRSSARGLVTSQLQFTFIKQPRLLSVTPSVGPLTGGTLVTITADSPFGASVGEVASVTLAGIQATIVSQNATAVIVQSPATAVPITGQVVVITRLRGTATGVITFSYLQPGVITSITPSAGTVFGGSLVTIAGSGFTDGSPGDVYSVFFGNVPAAIQSTSLSSVVVLTSPSQVATDVAVSIMSTSRGNTTSVKPVLFTFNIPGAISTVRPISGPAVGGTLVTISGTNFSTGADVISVLIVGIRATIISQSDTTVVVRTDVGTSVASTVPGSVILVSDSHGQSVATAAFTYNPPGVVTSLIPDNGPLTGGSLVTILGTSLGNNDLTSVIISGVSATVVSSTPSLLQVRTGAGVAAGNGSLEIRSTSFGNTSLANAWTYNPVGIVNSVVPNNGPLAGNITVTVIGTGLAGPALNDVQQVVLANIPQPVASILSFTSTAVVVNVGPTIAARSGPVEVWTVSRGIASGSPLYTYNPAGVLDTVVPNRGTRLGGFLVTLSGLGMGNGSDITSVSLAGVQGTIVSQSADSVVVTCGASTAVVTGDAVVRSTSRGVSTLTDGFSYAQRGVITAVTPDEAPAVGGTVVVIDGTNLGSGTDVFGVLLSGVPSTIINQTASRVTVRSGSGVAVANVAGAVVVNSTTFRETTSPGAFTYQVGTLNSVIPNQGPLAGATIVTISGINIGNGADIVSVTFGTSVATINSQTGNAVVVRTAANAAAGFAGLTVVSTSRGTMTLANAFQYLPPGNVTGVSPAGSRLGVTSTVTVTGNNLGSGFDITSVLIGNQTAQIQTQSSLSAVVTAPASATAGIVSVSVLSASRGVAVSNGVFEYYAPGVVTGLNPVGARLGVSVTVTVTGTNLGSGSDITSVLFGNQTAQIVSQSSTAVVVTAPSSATARNVSVTVASTLRGDSATDGTFEYFAAGVVTGVNPVGAPVGLSVTVTVTGTNLGSGSDITSVLFGNQTAQIVSQTAASVVVTAPASATAQIVSVTVASVSRGDSVTDGMFEYFAGGAVSSVNPVGSPLGVTSVVTISGTNLGSGNDITSVLFGNQIAQIRSQSNTVVVVTAPASATAQTVTVSVVSASRGAAAANGTFQYYASGNVTGVNPTGSPLAVTSTVTVTGTNLGSGSDITSVLFGNQTAQIVSQTAASVVVTAPASATARIVSVTVASTSRGDSVTDGMFEYYSAGTIANVSPSMGPSAGNTVVTITGTGLGSGNDITMVVLVNQVANIVSQTGTQVVVRSTAGSGSGSVSVRSVTRGVATLANSFLYSAGNITSIVPATGSKSGGDSITITGTGLGNGSDITSILLAGVPVASIQSQSASVIVVTTAAAPASGTTGPATVQSASLGMTQSETAFTYLTVPEITSVTPSIGIASGGTTITVNGTLLGSGNDITTATVVDVNATIISQSTSSVVLVTGAGNGTGDVVLRSLSAGVIRRINGYTYTSNTSLIDPCASHSTCDTCATHPGAAIGTGCAWCPTSSTCVTQATATCAGAVGDTNSCPSQCDFIVPCSACVAVSGCGWDSTDNSCHPPRQFKPFVTTCSPP